MYQSVGSLDVICTCIENVCNGARGTFNNLSESHSSEFLRKCVPIDFS